LAFVVLFGYAIARPATESLFLEAYGSESLPLVWAVVAAVAIAAVALYNAAAARFELTAVLVGAIALSGVTLALLLALWAVAPRAAIFALYVWKDVHIVVLLEALWSLANVVFSERLARWAYGVFCAAGSIGGIVGNLAVGVLADAVGTAPSLWLAGALFVVQAVVAVLLGRAAGRPQPERRPRHGLADGLRLLRRSSYLGWLLALVGVVQVVITLVDYQYNAYLEAAFPETDRRTAVIGQIYAAIDASSLGLQLATGLVIRAAGLRWTLLGVPLLFGAALAALVAVPRFAVMAVVKVTSKALDYSLFRAAKEILYIPLSYAEKTRGKALVDMLTYRVAKGGASIVLAVLIGAGTKAPLPLLALVLVGLWLALTVAVTRRHANLAEASEGERSEGADRTVEEAR